MLTSFKGSEIEVYFSVVLSSSLNNLKLFTVHNFFNFLVLIYWVKYLESIKPTFSKALILLSRSHMSLTCPASIAASITQLLECLLQEPHQISDSMIISLCQTIEAILISYWEL